MAGGAEGMIGGVDLAGGVDCAPTGSDDDTASMAPRMISQSLTAHSPVLDVGRHHERAAARAQRSGFKAVL
jgi:hypothetical protein